MQSSGSVRGNKRFRRLYHTMTSKKRTSLQALKLQAASIPTDAQGFKLQARMHKLKDPSTRVQAHKPTIRGASNKDKSIFSVLYVEGYLVG